MLFLQFILVNYVIIFIIITMITDFFVYSVHFFRTFSSNSSVGPKLINSVPSRIVTVSSLGHLRADFDMKVIDATNETYQPTVAYAFSKLSNVLFSKKMGELLKGK